MKTPEQFSNELTHETSPYLLQHAHNPVNWIAWNNQTIARAKAANKPIIISIGYSACHWCHVMEKESFENEEVAAYMNAHFTCVKVDREERPDVDQVYMDAVQLITQQGGWPLNAFAMPDGRPFYGGTYFPKDKWMNVLRSIVNAFENEHQEIVEYANKLTEGVNQLGAFEPNLSPADFDKEQLDIAIERWKNNLDNTYGGNKNAPKFPMPNNYQFMLDYASMTGNQGLLNFVYLTLDEMARGGIYDQLGGGFARYSVDVYWKVPHFEKMLYDNSQLISLYSNAYRQSKNQLYKNVVTETVAFCKRELSQGNGIYHSALDADSEGVEGKFYVWTPEELKLVWGENYDLLAAYYSVNEKGLWEDGNSILLRSTSDYEFAQKHGLSEEELHTIVQKGKETALEARGIRVRPGLDDKTLTSWTAMHISALCDAYIALGDRDYLEEALKIGRFIQSQQIQEDRSLWHVYSPKNKKSTVQGFLDDYCFSIQAFIKLYQTSMDEQWLKLATQLTEYAIAHFQNSENSMFYFTDKKEPTVVANKIETFDNVIPSSNSTMAKNLYDLGVILSNQEWVMQSKAMLNNVVVDVSKHPQSHSNWAILMQHFTHPSYELVLTGKEAENNLLYFGKDYYPNTIIAAATNESSVALFEGRLVNGQSLIYVCRNNACRLPTKHIKEALAQLKYS